MEFKFSILRGKGTSATERTETAMPPARLGRELIGSNVVQPWHGPALREEREFNTRMKRMYEAGITSNLNLDFNPTLISANSDILQFLYIARGRMRTLANDDATMSGILRADRNNICGHDPFPLEMQVKKGRAKDAKGSEGAKSQREEGAEPEAGAPGEDIPEFDEEINSRIEKAWDKWGRCCTVRRDKTFAEVCWTAVTAQKRDGSTILRKYEGFPYNKSGFAVREIESDRLQESYQGKADNGNPIRFSIERDRHFEFPVAYWLLTRHPGDSLTQMPNANEARTWRERVPAEEIIHFNNIRTRAEQDIGFPEYASIVQHLHLNRQFDRAHVTAAIWAQAKPFFIIQDYPTGMPYVSDPSPYFNPAPPGGFGGAVPEAGAPGMGRPALGNGPGAGRNVVKAVEPATGEVLDIGKKPFLVDPKFPNEAAPAFTKNQMESAARGSGKSYGTVSADFEKYSFSAARMALQPERDNYKTEQSHMRDNFVRPIFEAWLKCELLYGTLKDLAFSRYEEFCDAAVFHAKQWPYIQPVQDAQADILLMEENIKSPQEVIAESENPRCPADVLAEIAAFRALEKKHGLDEVEDVSMPTIKKGEPGQAQPRPGAMPEAGAPGKKRMEDLTLGEMRDILTFWRAAAGPLDTAAVRGRNGRRFKELARNGMLPGQED